MIEHLIRGFGCGLLKVVTVGRCTNTDKSAELFEGTVGLLALGRNHLVGLSVVFVVGRVLPSESTASVTGCLTSGAALRSMTRRG